MKGWAHPAMPEDAWQQRVTDYCDWLGLRWHHETDSRRSKAGFPDLVIVGKSVLYAELKTDTGKLRLAQAEWINDLREAGQEVHVWRPSQWLEVQERLNQLAKPRRAA